MIFKVSVLSTISMIGLCMGLQIQPSDIPTFDIDLSKAPIERHREVWEYFKDDLLLMEKGFLKQLNGMNTGYLKFFEDNLAQLEKVQPDVVEFAKSIQEELVKIEPTFTLADALLVNSIVDFSSFCTSIVAMNGTDLTHVRNLDFDFPRDMQKLIYNQRFINKEGEIVATAPSVAGFYGIYTAIRENLFSVSYNVRFTHQNKTQTQNKEISDLDIANMSSREQEIWTNLKLEISEDHTPFQNLIQDAVLNSNNYEEAVERLSKTNVNAPGYVILCNNQITKNAAHGQGIIIARSRTGVDNKNILSIEEFESTGKWYIVQTNMDVFDSAVHDPRYNKAIEHLDAMKNQIEPENLVENVLRQKGVQTSLTIFAVAMSPDRDHENTFGVYKTELESEQSKTFYIQ